MGIKKSLVLDVETARGKVGRYEYWAIRDKDGRLIRASDRNNPENISFSEALDEILKANELNKVDEFVLIKYGSNEQTTRNHKPDIIPIKPNDNWQPPTELTEGTVNINGIPHPVDKNGNVNINLTTPVLDQPKIETADVYEDRITSKFELQLAGLKQQQELREQSFKAEMMNELGRRDLQYREMLLERDRLEIEKEKERLEALKEELEIKQQEIQGNLKGYMKEIPNVLGGFISDFLKGKKAEEQPEQEKPEIRQNKKKARTSKPRTFDRGEIELIPEPVANNDFEDNDEFELNGSEHIELEEDHREAEPEPLQPDELEEPDNEETLKTENNE